MIIGLTGTLASGKGVVSDFLKEKGFVYLSLSNEVREIAKEKKIEITRENLQNSANQLRHEKGAGVFAEIVKEKIINQQYSKAVVDGIRNPAELEVLKKLKNFFLVAVDAPKEIRFKRMFERNRESDPKTWEDFLKVDTRDLGEEDEKGQQVGKCMEKADFNLINDSSFDEAKAKVKELYDKILLKIPRPNWDEYFMKMAALVAERSTCHRHNVGAVIVKGKRIMTTGYNGAAKGVKDCLDLGCIKNQQNLASGIGYETCRAIHAEQNAIIQAGVHGINISDSIMYCTHTPCMICAKAIVNANIKEVVSYHDFEGDRGAKTFLAEAGILLRKIDRPSGIIDFKD